MEFQIPNFLPAAGELAHAGMALLILLVVAFCRQRGAAIAYVLSLLTLIGVGLYHAATINGVDFTFGQMFFDDSIGDVLKAATCFAVALVLVYGRRYLRDRGLETGEYYFITLLATLGITVLICAGSLVTVYLGLELLSLASYGLVAINRDSIRSTEAAMKYFVLGALASGLLLYGMSMVYGATQSLGLIDIAHAIYPSAPGVQANQTVLLFGLVFLVAGIAFKLGLVPFHMWIPDVYEGAPSAVTAFLATASKLAAFAMAYRLLAIGMWEPSVAVHWQRMLMIVGLLSIILGNIAGVAQTNIKRMLGYSGISHMGFLVLGFGTGVIHGNLDFNVVLAYSSSMFYVLTYVLTSLSVFGIILLLSRAGFESENIDDFKGLNKRNSWWAGMMAIAMFSMAGIPFFVGFFAKFYVLQRVFAAGFPWLVVVAVAMSLIGAFYYLRVVKVMFFDAPNDDHPIEAGLGVRALLSVNTLALAVLGLLPGGLMDFCLMMVQASFE